MLHNKPGYSTLTFMLILTGIMLASGLFLHARIRTEQENIPEYRSRELASGAAHSCLEEAHMRLQLDRGYIGGQLNIDSALCTITIASQGSTYIIQSHAAVASTNRTYELTVTESGGKLHPDRFRELP